MTQWTETITANDRPWVPLRVKLAPTVANARDLMLHVFCTSSTTMAVTSVLVLGAVTLDLDDGT